MKYFRKFRALQIILKFLEEENAKKKKNAKKKTKTKTKKNEKGITASGYCTQ